MRLAFNFFSIILLLSLMACGSKNEPQDKTDQSDDMGANVAAVELEGNDQMQYNLKVIEVAAGSTVKLKLTHKGQMPLQTMGHNFVLLKQGVDIAAFAAKAISAMDNGYIPEDEKQNIIAYTKLIGGGESTTIEFAAPAPGTYKFLCSFPGHYAIMQGDFIVK